MTGPQGATSYRDIKRIVMNRMQSGVWRPETLLPSELDLAAEFSTTRSTVNRALRELADEGYLERKRKAGTRVLGAPVRQARFSIPLVEDEVAATGATYRYSLVEREVRPAPAWLSARLDLPKGQEMLFLRCMHYADSAPFQLEVRWIVAEVVPDVLNESFESQGPNGWLVRKIPFTNVEFSIVATAADRETAEFLDGAPGDPILMAERVTWLENAPVTHARLFFATGYRMTTRL